MITDFLLKKKIKYSNMTNNLTCPNYDILNLNIIKILKFYSLASLIKERLRKSVL